MSPASVKGNSSGRSFFYSIFRSGNGNKSKVSPANADLTKKGGSSSLTTLGTSVAPPEIKLVPVSTIQEDSDVTIGTSSSYHIVFTSSSPTNALQVRNMLPTTDPTQFSEVERKDVEKDLLTGKLFLPDGRIRLRITLDMIKNAGPNTPDLESGDTGMDDKKAVMFFSALVEHGYISANGDLKVPLEELSTFSGHITDQTIISGLQDQLSHICKGTQRHLSALYDQMTQELSPGSKEKLNSLIGKFGLSKVGILTAWRFMKAFTPEESKRHGQSAMTADELINNIDFAKQLFDAFLGGDVPSINYNDRDKAMVSIMWMDTALRGPFMFERGVTRYDFGTGFTDTMMRFLGNLNAHDRWSTHAKGTDIGEHQNAKGIDHSGANGQMPRLRTPFGLGNTLYEPTANSDQGRLVMHKILEMRDQGHSFLPDTFQKGKLDKEVLKQYCLTLYSPDSQFIKDFDSFYASISERRDKDFKDNLGLFATGISKDEEKKLHYFDMSMVLKSEVHGLGSLSEKLRHLKARDLAIGIGTFLGVVPGVLIWGITKATGWGVRYNPNRQINAADKALMTDEAGSRVKVKSKEHLSALQTKCKPKMFSSKFMDITTKASKAIFETLVSKGIIVKKTKTNTDSTESKEFLADYVINPTLNGNDPQLLEKVSDELATHADRIGISESLLKTHVAAVLKDQVCIRTQVLRMAADLSDYGISVGKKDRFKSPLRPQESIVMFHGKPAPFTIALKAAKDKITTQSYPRLGPHAYSIKQVLELLEKPLDQLNLKENQTVWKSLFNVESYEGKMPESIIFSRLVGLLFNLSTSIPSEPFKKLVQRYANILADYKSVSPNQNPLTTPNESREVLNSRQRIDGKDYFYTNGLACSIIDQNAGFASERSTDV
jgi:hypothetical protein